MSPQKVDNERRRRSYAAKLLKMNPLEAPDDIVAVRGRFLRLRDPLPRRQSGAGATDLRELREKVTARLDEVRAQFWTMELDKLRRTLDGLEIEHIPDLKQAADRLRTVAEHRHVLPPLSQQRNFDGDFFGAFKRVLVLPAREAAAFREKVTAAFRTPARLKRVRRMLALLERETPALYALEAEWFGELEEMRVRPRKKASRPLTSSSGETDGTSFGWLVWILIIAAIKILSLWARHSNHG